MRTKGKRLAADRKIVITHPLVGIIMGSGSDWDTMKFVSKTLGELGVPHETRVVSAHRTPDLLFKYASNAEKRGIEVIIAGAGGAAHLPGMTASKTVLPVLGVPVESKALKGLDSLLSIAQMPGGVPVGTLAIGRSGAVNAALLAVSILGTKRPRLSSSCRSRIRAGSPRRKESLSQARHRHYRIRRRFESRRTRRRRKIARPSRSLENFSHGLRWQRPVDSSHRTRRRKR